jgi:DNA-binding CsgD family transcriptional regulator
MSWESINPRAQIDAGHIAKLVDHVDAGDFDATLLGILQEKGPAAEVNGFLYARRDRDPRPVAWCGRPDGTALRVDRYARNYHRLDPTLHSLPNPVSSGASLVDVLTPSRISDSAYRRMCFEAPAFSRKISVAHADPGGEWTILNIYLNQDGAGDDTVQRLAAFGTFIAPFLRKRSRGFGPARFPNSTEYADEHVGRRLKERFPTLTERETRVCALTMIGKTSGEIATTLGIRPGTVITYRRRAYERLGVSSAASLVPELF